MRKINSLFSSGNSFFPIAVLILSIIALSFISGCGKSSPNAVPVPNKITECKTFGQSLSVLGSDPSKAVIAYEYSGNTLTITHYNAGFNCCIGGFHIDVNQNAQIIAISESDVMDGLGCHCLCLYDIAYSVANISPGDYTIKIDEKYLSDQDPQIQFNLSLEQGKSGSLDFSRSVYPWGWENN